MHINISRLSKPEPLEKSMQSSLVKAFQLELIGLTTIEPTVVFSEKISVLCKHFPPSALRLLLQFTLRTCVPGEWRSFLVNYVCIAVC